MGVTNLIKVITKECGDTAIKKYDLTRFSGMTVAVDASLMVYKTVLAKRAGGKDMVNKKGELTSHLHGVLQKILKFLENGIIPIFVFDGKAPDIKNKTAAKRNEKRQNALDNLAKLGPNADIQDETYLRNFKESFRPTKENFKECQIMLDLMGIPYICAPGEADVVCAWLSSRTNPDGKRWAKGVCSDDSDMLVFGAPYLFKDMSKFMKPQSQITVVSLHKCLVKMNITMEQFIDMCVLLGCDHCSNIPKVGMAKVYPHIVDHGKLEKIIKLYKQKRPELVDTFDFDVMIETKNYFKNAVNEIDESDFIMTDHNSKLRVCQSDELIDFMCVKHDLDMMKIESFVDKLKACYKKMNITAHNIGKYHKILQVRSVDYMFLPSEESEEAVSDSVDFFDSDSDSASKDMSPVKNNIQKPLEVKVNSGSKQKSVYKPRSMTGADRKD